MGEQKKKLVLMGVLLVVLIISWTVVLSPKKKSGKAVPGKLPENITSQAAAPPLQNNFNLSEVERTMKEARAALTAVEETETGGKGADWGKNPFSPWGPPARSVSPVMTHSILKETRPGLPTFTLSGIIYDRARPLAIINEQVCTESERLEGYQVYRIYPDRVVLKSSEHTLVLKITSSGGTELVEEKVLAEQKEKEKTSEVSAVGVSEVKEKNFLSGKKEERQVKSGSGATFKTVQVLSVPEENISQAKEEGKKLANQGFDRVRLLKDDDFVVLRVGAYQRMSEAKEVWAKLRPRYRYAFVKTVTPESEAGRIIEEQKAEEKQENIATSTREVRSVKRETAVKLEDPARIITIQVSSHPASAREEAVRVAQQLEESGYPEVRTEYINGVYTVRVGRWVRKEENLTTFLKELKEFREDSFLRTAYYLPERIVYPTVNSEQQG